MGTALTKPKSTSLSNWESQLKKDSQLAVASVQGVGLGNFIQTRNGKLQVAGAPVKDNKFKCVVLDHLAVNAYYGGEKFDSANPVSPICYAFAHVQSDGTMPEMEPHEKAESKQNAVCKDCRWNAFKSDDRGKGKACKNIRRLALIHADSLKSADLTAKASVFYLNVPVTSVAGWANYVRSIGSVMERPPYAVVTEVECVDDDKTQFRLLFNLAEKITDKKVLKVCYDRHVAIEEDLVQPYPANAGRASAKKTKKSAAQRKKVSR